MQNRVSKQLYERLRNAKTDGFVPHLGIPFAIALATGFWALPLSLRRIQGQDIYMVVAVVSLVLTAIIGGIMLFYISKNKKIGKKLSENNNALAYPARLMQKNGRTSRRPRDDKKLNLYDVTVSYEGRQLTVKATQDVFTLCCTGEEVWLVDLMGENAANPHTCVAVMKSELNSGDEYYRSSPPIGDNMFRNTYDISSPYGMPDDRMHYSGDSDHSESTPPAGEKMSWRSTEPALDEHKSDGRLLYPDENLRLKRIERSRLILPLILPLFFGVVLLLCVLAKFGVFSSMAGNIIVIILSNQATLIFFSILFVFSILLFFAVGIDAIERLNRLSSGILRCDILMLKQANSSRYRFGKYSYYDYFYTCVGPDGSQRVFMSRKPSKVSAGQKVLAVYYGQNDTKLYKLR